MRALNAPGKFLISAAATIRTSVLLPVWPRSVEERGCGRLMGRKQGSEPGERQGPTPQINVKLLHTP
jgi:hypothetical protein